MASTDRVFTQQGAAALIEIVKQKLKENRARTDRILKEVKPEEHLAQWLGNNPKHVRLILTGRQRISLKVKDGLESVLQITRQQFESMTEELESQSSTPRITKKDLAHAVLAWRKATFKAQSEALVNYYHERDVPLFSYPFLRQSKVRTPLYVRKEWKDLDDSSIHLTLIPEAPTQDLNVDERVFLDVFQNIREAMKLKPIFDGRIFRLIQLETAAGNVRMTFTKGTFFPCAACQYFIEHELNLALLESDKPLRLAARDKLAGSPEAIESFCQKKAVRAGISNLLLLRTTDDQFKPYIQRRDAQSMQRDIFDCVTSGFFDIRTRPKLDFDIRRKVFTEVGEELFGKAELALPYTGDDPSNEERESWRMRLAEMIDDHETASFHVTGLAIDLIRLVPEITTVFVVRDKSYYREFSDKFHVSKEFGEYPSLDTEVRIPQNLIDVNQFMREQMLREPDDPDAGIGFEPLNWTMTGAFCFYQGLLRAVRDGLLRDA